MDADKPVIGLCASFGYITDWGGENRLKEDRLLNNYSQAIFCSGGLPLVIPFMKEADVAMSANRFANCLDALVLTGGGDIACSYPSDISLRNPDCGRDNWEKHLLLAFLKLKKPILGICRGLQVINWALGGTLIGDIPSFLPQAINHEQKVDRHKTSHLIKIEPGTLLSSIIGCESLAVNSAHHQGILNLASNLIVSACSSDGVVEAIESSLPQFLLAVQWHPEALDDLASKALFDSFIKATFCEVNECL